MFSSADRLDIAWCFASPYNLDQYVIDRLLLGGSGEKTFCLIDTDTTNYQSSGSKLLLIESNTSIGLDAVVIGRPMTR